MYAFCEELVEYFDFYHQSAGNQSIQSDLKLWPFKVVSGGLPDDKPLIEVTYQNKTQRF